MQREVQKQREALEDERRSIQAQLQHDNDERMAQAERGLDEFRRKLEETLAAKYLSKLTALESTLEEFQREARSKVKCMEEMAVQELALKKDNERLSAENKSLKDKAAQLVQSFVAEAPSAQETDMRKRQDEQHEKDSLKAEIEALQCRLVEAQESSIMAAAQLQERNKRISALMEVNAALENQVQERQEHFDKIEGTLSELEKHAFEMPGKRMAQAAESPELGSQVAGNFDQGGSEAVFDHVPEHDVAHTEASLATPTVYESKDQAAFVHGQHRSQAGAFVGGAEMWSIFIQEGRPVPGNLESHGVLSCHALPECLYCNHKTDTRCRSTRTKSSINTTHSRYKLRRTTLASLQGRSDLYLPSPHITVTNCCPQVPQSCSNSGRTNAISPSTTRTTYAKSGT